MSLYGTRDAAQNWQNTVERNLKKIGFKQGSASGSVYYHGGRNISTLVHGDDYVSVGAEADLEWLRVELENDYDIKTTIVGRRRGLEKEVRVLNRIIRWTEEGWEYEADQRHGEIIVGETCAEDVKPVMTPIAESKEEADDDEELEGEGSR